MLLLIFLHSFNLRVPFSDFMNLVGDIFVLLLSCRGGRYTEEDAKTIVVQILSVVAFCHLQGVVHRDLKPEVQH